MTSSSQRRTDIEISDAEIEAAYRRGEEQLATEPLAIRVRYSRARDSVVVDINNGASLVIPRRLMQGLRDVPASKLHGGMVEAQGTIVSWPDLDAYFTVISLLRGVYGGRRWMSELARHAGSTTSPAKAAAARANGRKGGRPRKKTAGSRRASSRKQ